MSSIRKDMDLELSKVSAALKEFMKSAAYGGSFEVATDPTAVSQFSGYGASWAGKKFTDQPGKGQKPTGWRKPGVGAHKLPDSELDPGALTGENALKKMNA